MNEKTEAATEEAAVPAPEPPAPPAASAVPPAEPLPEGQARSRFYGPI